LYQFNHVSPGEEKWGAFHTSEVPYALHTLHTWNLQWTDEDKKLEDIISSYWVNFAATGNPNGAGLPQWDAYDLNTNEVMVLNADEQKIKSISAKAEFDFIDKYQQKLRGGK
jgi:para-nitrobenzyl esterase